MRVRRVTGLALLLLLFLFSSAAWAQNVGDRVILVADLEAGALSGVQLTWEDEWSGYQPATSYPSVQGKITGDNGCAVAVSLSLLRSAARAAQRPQRLGTPRVATHLREAFGW